MVGLSVLRNRGLAAKDILLHLAGGCFRQLGHNNRGQTNDEAPAFAELRRGRRTTNTRELEPRG